MMSKEDHKAACSFIRNLKRKYPLNTHYKLLTIIASGMLTLTKGYANFDGLGLEEILKGDHHETSEEGQGQDANPRRKVKE